MLRERRASRIGHLSTMSSSIGSSTWQALIEHQRALRGRTLTALFDASPQRFERLSLVWEDWLADWSKQRLTPETMSLLVAHAQDRNLPGWIEALFNGEKINLSEGRPALHTALRQQTDAAIRVDGADIIPAIRAAQARMRSLEAQLRGRLRLGATGRPIRHVVNLGVGGSDLGPRLVCEALAGPRAFRSDGIDVAFVSNIDPEQLTRALTPFDPESTLFIVASKTFTTSETMANAHAARDWLTRFIGGGGALSSHFVAVTANAEAAHAFGVAGQNVLPVWDWVGGRYSLWSAVGLPIAIRCGWDAFAGLLAGAASMDAHFREARLDRNLPVLLALVDFWNARVLGHPQRIVVPYAHALSALPAYLQQLSLESNGKSIARDGTKVDGPTAPALWGGTGTDSQHAFFQWLHQGTHVLPVEFIVPVRAAHAPGDQQAMLIANALAQSQALMVGKALAVARAELAARGLSPSAVEAQAPQRACAGDRPSSTLILPGLDARRLGQLLALYEHRTFVEGVLMGINSFDQWGVELGKALANPLLAAIREGAEASDVDASTRGLSAHVRALSKSLRIP